MHLVEIHLHGGFRAHVVGAEAARQHPFHRAREAQFGGAADALVGQHHAGGADRGAGAGQQVAAGIDDGDVLRLEPGHRGGDQVQDRLHPVAVERSRTLHGEQHARLRRAGFARERRTVRQHEVDAGGAHALDRLDRAGELAFHGAGFVDAFLERGHAEHVGVVEDAVADGTARGQALAGEQHARGRDLVFWDQDFGTAGGKPVGDVGAAEGFRHLAGIAQREVAVEQRHGLGAAAEHEQGQQGEGA